MLGPLKLRPVLKEKVWGGDRLRRLGKDVPPGGRVGEAWEVSDRGEDSCTVAEGALAGRRLAQVLAQHAGDVYGDGPGPLSNGRFPLLIKFLDASDRLSIQVHPDDAYAAAHNLGDAGKTECWYVLEPPDEGLALGLKADVTREQFEALARAGRAEECVRYEPAPAGQLVFCPAGTVHAITPPALLVEIQQNSDITYRLSDWGGVGDDGKPRMLHVEQAIGVTKLRPAAPFRPEVKTVQRTPFLWERLVDCDKFTVGRWTVDSDAELESPRPEFQVFICVEGQGDLKAASSERLSIRAGDTVLAPACVRRINLSPGPRMVLLHVTGRR